MKNLKLRKRIIAIAATIACVGAFSLSAFAGTAYAPYNTTVGKLNGSGYTGYQTKTTTGSSANVSSTSVGASYQVDVRQNGSSNGSWFRNLDDNMSIMVNGVSGIASGTNVRLEFSNNALTPVAVQVIGSWKSN